MAVSAFMITMDNTVVANALPTMMRDLGMSNSAKDWVATGYILMFSCLMIAGGRLTDVYGCRLTFTAGMAVFTASSAVCGLAGDEAILILGRIVQGAGAALALPATLVMVTVGRTDKQRSIGTIVWVGAASGATALGPAIGGFIVQQWHWGWIFLINIVPGILVILLGLVVLTSKGENKNARVDLPGVLISATMLFALAYGLETGRKHGWTDPSVLSVFALAAIALTCFIVVETWAPDPMMNLRFFRNRVFVGGLLSQMLWGIGFNGMIFYSATFLQRYLDFSPPQAGLVMMPPAIAIMVLTPLGFWLAAKLGPRPIIGGGMAAMAAGMVMFSALHRGDGFADLMPGVMIVGIGAALCMPLAMYVLKAVPEDQAGVASGILNVIREVSGAFGIAIVGLLIHEVPPENAAPQSLEAFRDGTSKGLILGATLVLVGGLISGLTLPSKRGWLGPKHGKQSHRIPYPDTLPSPRATTPDPIPTLRANDQEALLPVTPLPAPPMALPQLARATEPTRATPDPETQPEPTSRAEAAPPGKPNPWDKPELQDEPASQAEPEPQIEAAWQAEAPPAAPALEPQANQAEPVLKAELTPSAEPVRAEPALQDEPGPQAEPTWRTEAAWWAEALPATPKPQSDLEPLVKPAPGPVPDLETQREPTPHTQPEPQAARALKNEPTARAEAAPPDKPNPWDEPELQDEPASQAEPEPQIEAAWQAEAPPAAPALEPQADRAEPVLKAELTPSAEPVRAEPALQVEPARRPEAVPEPALHAEPEPQIEPVGQTEPVLQAEIEPVPQTELTWLAESASGVEPEAEPVQRAEPTLQAEPVWRAKADPSAETKPSAGPGAWGVSAVVPRYPAKPRYPVRHAGDTWPPPPPEGWYQPYVPGDAVEPEDEERSRGDAW
ncbi:MFS transporter [Actinomadura rudentiformis]|uniref:MFS transporter n=1 Tax=Actinomadura rudentiformis TaxID=359158 RepID=UPI0021F4F4DE|nr:MDR family MFS transporter [Actinomadura rudentiformis]